MSARPTAVLVAPGRGSYTAQESGYLSRHDARPEVRAAAESWLATFDAQRAEAGLESLRTLDATPFQSKTHLQALNASALIFAASCLDARALADRFEVVAVAGNSLGWYSALGIADALPIEETHRLIQTLALLQREVQGGQILYPCVDETTWRVDPALRSAVEEAVDAVSRELGPDALGHSIALGGYAVLWGSEAGLRAAAERLPPLERGPRRFPLRLAMHGPFHGPRMESVSVAAREALANLPWSAPAVPLIDGRGVIHEPWSADPAELAEYTLGAQLTRTFDYTTTLRVAVREFQPDALVLLGPGNPLGGPTAQILIADGWRGLHSRADFERAQLAEDRPLVSYGLEAERVRIEGLRG